MNNYQKLGLIAGQIFVGLGFGLGATLATAIIVFLIFDLIGRDMDLYGPLLIAAITGYISMQVGISYDGYKILKRHGRQADFLRFFVQSVFGLLVGLIAFYLLVMTMAEKFREFELNRLVNFLAMTLPLIGAILGFDIGLIKRLSDTERLEG
jgi:hypothetical protein